MKNRYNYYSNLSPSSDCVYVSRELFYNYALNAKQEKNFAR